MRVLFSCMPWEGHFRPLVPLAHALAARGHDVAFAAASVWEPRTEEEGFPLFAAGLSQDEGRALFAPFREKIFQLPPEGRRTHQFSKLFAMIHAPAKLPEVLGVARSWRADAIVHDRLRPRGSDRRRLARATVCEPLLRGDDPARRARGGARVPRTVVARRGARAGSVRGRVPRLVRRPRAAELRLGAAARQGRQPPARPRHRRRTASLAPTSSSRRWCT